MPAAGAADGEGGPAGRRPRATEMLRAEHDHAKRKPAGPDGRPAGEGRGDEDPAQMDGGRGRTAAGDAERRPQLPRGRGGPGTDGVRGLGGDHRGVPVCGVTAGRRPATARSCRSASATPNWAALRLYGARHPVSAGEAAQPGGLRTPTGPRRPSRRPRSCGCRRAARACAGAPKRLGRRRATSLRVLKAARVRNARRGGKGRGRRWNGWTGRSRSWTSRGW